MTDQLVNHFPFLKPISGFLAWLESLPLRRAKGAVVVCEALADCPRRLCPGETMLLPDVSLREITDAPAEDIRQIVGQEGPILMYVGNLEPYQGIDLLLESFSLLEKKVPSARLVLIGGSEAGQSKYKNIWHRLSGSENVFFLGPRPLAALSGYLEQSNAVVSPRIQGTNTPMKIYSYLDSGRPLVATSLPTHTQVVSADEAALAEPTPEAFANAMAKVIADPEYSDRLASNARGLVARKYSPASFRLRVREFYSRLEACLATT
jgi:glycosyltransferase involved in cell wall biosynthesis